MTEAEVKLQARLFAIEYLLENVFIVLHRIVKTSPESVLELHRRIREMLSLETIPGVDPVQADMMLAEMQEAVEKILASIEEILKVAKKP
jgi:hypothetical protein